MTVQSGSRIDARPHLRAVPRHGMPAVPPKFAPPRFPPDLVGLDPSGCLAQLASHELALVCAPVGYGKTAWSAALFAEARASGWHAAWLSVDEDDETADFADQLAETVRSARRGEADAAMPGSDVRTQVARIAAQIDADDMPFLLVLDDADRLSASGIDLIDRLLRHPPAQLRLVLAGRTRVRVALGDIEGRGMMMRVGAKELAIADEEAARFAGNDKTRVFQLLEGWPAGLRLSARSVCLDALIDQLDAYLAPMIAALSVEERIFLQRLASVSRFNAELGRLLSGDKDADARIGALTAKGIFIEPVAQQPGWHRLHPAFRAILQRQLAVEEPEAPEQLHRAAARYLASLDMIADAAEQALAGEDFDRAATLIAKVAMPMIERGDLRQLAAWLDALPSTDVPALFRARAWVLMLTASDKTAAAIVALDTSGDANEARAIDLVRRAYLDDAMADVVETCDQILAAPDGVSDLAAAMVRAVLAQGALKRGLFGLVHEVVRPLLLRGAKQPFGLPLALATCTRASLARAQGQLTEAERVLRDGRPASANGLAAALIDAALARCCYERDDFTAAATLAQRALPLLDASPFQDAQIHAYLVAIRVAVVTDEPGKAASLIDRAELVAFERGWSPLKAMCVVERARLRLPPTIDPEAVLAIGDEEAAIRDPLSVQGRAFALLAEMRAYEAIASGDRPRLTMVADHLLLLASAADDAELRASATLFNILPQLSGRCDKMVELETVRFLNHAASSGFRRTIVDVLDVTGVRAVQNFCSEAYSSGSFLALLKLAEPSRRNPALEGGPGVAPGEAFSFLTEREIEILSALNAGESNKEIARSLQLAPETVKWHLKNVMRKLRAGSREEAVANAATLGLKLIEIH